MNLYLVCEPGNEDRGEDFVSALSSSHAITLWMDRWNIADDEELSVRATPVPDVGSKEMIHKWPDSDYQSFNHPDPEE